MSTVPDIVTPFAETLASRNLSLRKSRVSVLQINVGTLCDLACRHCHLEAGPSRIEVMSRSTMEQVISLARSRAFPLIDITGGAPELVPDIDYLLSDLAACSPQLVFRTNLTALALPGSAHLMPLLRDLRATIVASLPSTNQSQAEAQRGNGAFTSAIDTMKKLNALGYGIEGSGLLLNLTVNPVGAFLPQPQCDTERRFKTEMARKYGVSFNQAFTFANVPLGRFRQWLQQSGNLEGYLRKLADGFNPDTVDGLMCRTLISVSWDGFLYDCDFNLAAAQGMAGHRIHITQLPPSLEGQDIPTGDYCYACTAGTGFT
jgi:radical SAM/Cys-rich protein